MGLQVSDWWEKMLEALAVLDAGGDRGKVRLLDEMQIYQLEPFRLNPVDVDFCEPACLLILLWDVVRMT